MGTVKVSITLDEANVGEAKALVGERGFSRFVDECLGLQLQRMRLREMLTELDREYGPVPEEMREAARREAEQWPR